MGRWYPSIEVASIKGDHSGTLPLVPRSRYSQTQAGVSGGRAAFANISGEDSSVDQTDSQCWAFPFNFNPASPR